MGQLLDSLKTYLQNATKEDLEDDWEQLKKYNKIGPFIMDDKYIERIGYNKKRISHKTIINRIKSGHNICPVCGCSGRHRETNNFDPEDIYIVESCSRCGILLCWADNTPIYEVCEEIRRLKHITYKGCLRIVRWFDEH